MRTDEISVMIPVVAILLVSTLGYPSGVSDQSGFYRLHDIPEWNATIYGLNFAAPLQISDKDSISEIKLIDVEMLEDELRMLASGALANLSRGMFFSQRTLKIPVGLGRSESQMPVSYGDLWDYFGTGNGGAIQLPEHVSYRNFQFREISDGYRESSGGVDVVWNFS
ncbi:MAG: hypothetical protein H5T42_00030 [Methanothrix sp.]|jgi:hypothetical protein|uniref:hypothetical protein n=1 Tax=Methanothrix sp. TaxID=90426 RepID=UPI0019BA6E89|nr:hypothetical protein [Methanothrix sp.]MBC7078859.1 hypothetical protein [Methanothrix sp.]NPU87022.1 hypothetical protein [Methanothrix sp.]